MIWIVLLIVLLATFLWVSVPLYAPNVSDSDDGSIDAYRREITHLDGALERASEPDEINILRARQTLLQRQLLRADSGTQPASTGPKRAWLAVIAVMVFAGGFGLYAKIGEPNAPKLLAQNAAPKAAPTVTPGSQEEMDILLAELGERLTRTGGDVAGWQIYARALITRGQYDDALSAYDKAVTMSGEDATMIDEREQAKAYVAMRQAASALSGPSADDIVAAEGMSETDRADMIAGMVDGLSQKLRDDPSDVAGWVRLLQARGVLGQTDIAITEIERLEAAFADDPETIALILNQSGWVEGEGP